MKKIFLPSGRTVLVGRNVAAALTCIMASFAVGACAASNDPVSSLQSTSPASSVVEMTADYPVLDGVSEAVEKSDDVVVVKYLDSRSELVLPDSSSADASENPQAGIDISTLSGDDLLAIGVPTTYSRAEVIESPEGDIPVGSIITIEQDGGVIDGVKYRESSTSLLSEAGFKNYVLLVKRTASGYTLVDPVLGVFGKDGSSVKPLKPNLIERASDREIHSLSGILKAPRE